MKPSCKCNVFLAAMQVLVLSRTLAVKTLQLELGYIFAALEDEALDVAQGTKDAGFLLSR